MDQITRLEQRMMSLETLLGVKYGLPGAPDDQIKVLKANLTAMMDAFNVLDKKVRVLEEARQRQISFNSLVSKELEEANKLKVSVVNKLTAPPTKSEGGFFNRLFRN